jgi:hypothetical protein
VAEEVKQNSVRVKVKKALDPSHISSHVNLSLAGLSHHGGINDTVIMDDLIDKVGVTLADGENDNVF